MHPAKQEKRTKQKENEKIRLQDNQDPKPQMTQAEKLERGNQGE